MTSNQKAILAGGCFWGLQDLIRNQPGVVSTRVGYSGGNIPNATYRNHGTHAEAVEIIFDPTVTDYRIQTPTGTTRFVRRSRPTSPISNPGRR